MTFLLRLSILRNAQNLQLCSTSRLTDETVKILASGHSREIIHELYKYGLLQYILPMYAVHSELPFTMKSLASLDEIVLSNKEKGLASPDKATMFYYMIRSAIIVDRSNLTKWDEISKDAFRQAKVMLSPITPSNADLEKAVTLVLEYNGIKNRKKIKEKKSPEKVVKHKKKKTGKKKSSESNTVKLL